MLPSSGQLAARPVALPDERNARGAPKDPPNGVVQLEDHFLGSLATGTHSPDFAPVSHFQRPPSSSSAKTTISADSWVAPVGITTGAIWISLGIGCLSALAPPPRLRRLGGDPARYFFPAKNSLIFSPLNLAPSTIVWPTPANISLNPVPT